MKKLLLWLVLTTAANFCSYAQDDPIATYPTVTQNAFAPKTFYPLSQYLAMAQYSNRMKGKLKSVTDKEYEIVNGEIQREIYSGSIISNLDENQNLIRQAFSNQLFIYNYELDEGKRIKEMMRNRDGRETNFSFQYDEEHRVIRRTMDDIEINFMYGADGNPKQAIFKSGGKLWITDTYIYNKSGYSIIEKSTDPKDVLRTLVFINDNLTEVRESKNNGQSTIVTYKYDIAGNIIETTNSRNGEVYRYEFSDVDSKGNWTKRICFKGKQNKVGRVINRTIEYYD